MPAHPPWVGCVPRATAGGLTEMRTACGKLLTQFLASVRFRMWQVGARPADGMDAMCMVSVETLSFPTLLEDPLIRLMMDSDGVSAGDLRELMSHMRDVVASRGDADKSALGLETVD